jgi:hypothetical protein
VNTLIWGALGVVVFTGILAEPLRMTNADTISKHADDNQSDAHHDGQRHDRLERRRKHNDPGDQADNSEEDVPAACR